MNCCVCFEALKGSFSERGKATTPEGEPRNPCRPFHICIGRVPKFEKGPYEGSPKKGTQHQEPKIPTRIVIRSAYISTTTPSKGVLILRNHGNLHIPQPHQAGLVLGIATPTRLLLDEL